MKGDQMGILAAYPTQRELPLSNQTRFKSTQASRQRGLVANSSSRPAGRFGSKGWRRSKGDSCSRRRAMETENVGQRWGERGQSLGGVQRGPGPSAGGREALSAGGAFFDCAGGGGWRGGGVNWGWGLGARTWPGGPWGNLVFLGGAGLGLRGGG